MLYVVNPYRPLTETPEQAEEVMREIEASSRLRVSGLVNNANLGEQTTWADIEAAAPMSFDALASRTGLPVLLVTTVMIPLEPDAQRPDHIFSNSEAHKNIFLGRRTKWRNYPFSRTGAKAAACALPTVRKRY